MIKTVCLLAFTLLMAACAPEDNGDDQQEQVIVRGLKTMVVGGDEHSVARRFPSVLKPSESSIVAFEIAGRLTTVNLKVGQTVAKGELLAQLEDEALNIQVASAQSRVEQAKVNAKNASNNLARQQKLFSKGTITRVAVDNAKVDATNTNQALVQAKQALETAKKSAAKAKLFAPFDGVIGAINAKSFTTIGAGSPVATLNRVGGFEVRFSANYNTVERLEIGKEVTLRLADDPSRVIKGIVSELGNSADTVSTFPVVVAVDKTTTGIKSGMAVEVQLEFDLPESTGFVIPFSAAVIEGNVKGSRNKMEATKIHLFVYDPSSQSVKKRQVTIAGVRENSFLVLSGLEAGERVASAGVSFLTDGQPVKLLED